jgi:hypothetical protein
MTDQFQCQYCGNLAPLSKAIMAWHEDIWKRDGEDNTDDLVFSMTICCSPSCADRVNELRVSR